MRSGEHKVARAYVLYREERAQQRRSQHAVEPQEAPLHYTVKLPNGRTEPLDEKQGPRDNSRSMPRTRWCFCCRCDVGSAAQRL